LVSYGRRQFIEIVVWRLLRLRITMRFHPLLGEGTSAKANSFVLISTTTATAGNLPFRLPDEARSPSMVTVPFFSIKPDQIITPDVGPWYTGGAVRDGAGGMELGGGIGDRVTVTPGGAVKGA
jgi:hypothetical protein